MEIKIIDEHELKEMKIILDTFRPIVQKFLTKEEEIDLMANMANVLHTEYYDVKIKLPFPKYLSETAREKIRRTVSAGFNSLVSRRLITEINKVIATR